MGLNIPVDAKIKSAASQATDKAATAQKESQVATQAQSLAQQGSAKAADALQDAKAMTDKLNKELGQIPQKVEDTEDDIIDKLKGFLGASPNIKPKKIKAPDGFEYEVPDFDPDKVLNTIKSMIDPMMSIASPIEGIAGKIPLLGDLIPLLTQMSTDSSGETDISEEELYKLIPTAPDIPPSVIEKAEKIVKLIGQVIQYLPIFLIDAIVQMLQAIKSMFDQIVGIIGVPPMIFPFSLVDSLAALVPKVKQLILTTPPEIEELIKQKIKKKFHYAAALSIPKPNLEAAKSAASSAAAAAKSAASSAASAAQGAASSVASGSVPTKIEQSQPPPAASNIPETPSVPEAKPEPPVKKLPRTCSFFTIKIISVWGEDDNELDPAKTRVDPSDRDDDQTIIDYIDAIIKKYPNIKKVGDHYEFNSVTKEMTRLQAFEYFNPIFSNFWKRKERLKNLNGHTVNLTRNAEVFVCETTGKQWPVEVTYSQLGYEDLKDENGDIYESDEEFKFPDGFLTV